MKVTDKITITNEDNMLLMARYPDNYFDLAIVDPPYRDINQPTKDMRNSGSMKSLEGRPQKEYFDELIRVSKNQIIWGANNFQLPQFMGFIVWKKLTISEDFTMSMAEIASLSNGLGTTSKIFEYAPQGKKEDPRIHPTQKPVPLYKWLLDKYAKKQKCLNCGGTGYSEENSVLIDSFPCEECNTTGIISHKILDTHLGSGSIAIACHDYGFELTACELDKEYYDKAIQRIVNHTNQQKLF
jgi:site-specific DNA-methyltransferase (adenine-specific)